MSPSRARTFLIHATLTALSLTAATLSFAQPADSIAKANAELDEIVVTALRLPTNLNKSGSSVWIMTEEQIKDRGFVYLTDALASVPGVTINQNGPFGGQAAARIRGASSDQTLVMIDGVIVNETSTPGGGFDFGSIELTDIERIEVVKGPQSTLWGSDAIGGVINIVSKQGTQELSGNLSLMAGSFGTQQYRGSVSAGSESGDFRVHYSGTESAGISKADEDDGNREDDAYDSNTIALKLGLNLPGDSRLQIDHRDSDTDSEFDSFGNATGVQDGDELSEFERTTTQFRLAVPVFKGRLQNSLMYARSEVERDSITNGVSAFSSEGERKVFQYQGTYQINPQQQLSFGYEDEQSESSSGDSDIQGLYALYQVSPTEDISLSFGIRQDDHSEYGNETVGRVSAAWAATKNLGIQFSWGEGFKAPTIFQTTFFCCGATAPNPNLAPETSDAFDIGFNWRFSQQGSLAMTYFNQDTENQIDFSFAIGGYENIAEVDSKGVELSFNYSLSDSIFTSTNIAYINSEDGNGNELIRLPELTGDLSLTWQPRGNIRSTLAVIYNADEKDPRGTVDRWTRIDVSGTWTPKDNIEVYARLENLTDRDYQQVFGYGTPDRSAYIGLRYRF